MILLCKIYCLFEEILIVLVSAYLILAHKVTYPFKCVPSSEGVVVLVILITSNKDFF